MMPSDGLESLNGRQVRIVRTMRTWRPFSDSNPSDDIIYAISTFWSPEKKISVYVFGDDFQGRSVEQVVREIDSVNRVGADGRRMVRIHAVGFPMFEQTNFQIPPTVGRFAQLMRILCDRNGGTFVALSTERS